MSERSLDQLAQLPTNIFAVGNMDGASSKQPAGTTTLFMLSATIGNAEPQCRQKLLACLLLG